ncbi:MAG: amidohydrolase family protein [Acidobacteria bacterium]|nr:amidohydrolase family protein [Acidobacteriota bacterium]
MGITEFDLIIRDGTVIDGSGSPPRKADVAITDGVIAGVGTAEGGEGTVDGDARTEIDATGLLVTPGFVDIHTHYDGQATWSNRMTPSSWHGVTTVVMGNCGVGFAPCRPEDHHRLIELMEGVEDIPGVVLDEGLSWNWESFGEYLDALDDTARDVDVVAQLPHGALRLYVMGERAARLEPATESDIAEMADLARAAIDAGAIGFSSSRTLNHRTSTGDPTPTLKASADELAGIAEALRDAGTGVLQFVTDFTDAATEMAMLEDLSRRSGRPLSVSLAQSGPGDSWKHLLDWIERANDAGVALRGQVAGRPVGLMLGFDLTLNPFMSCSSFRALTSLETVDKLAALGTEATRNSILAESADADPSLLDDFTRIFVLGDPPDYEQPADQTVAARAEQTGVPAAEYAYDAMVQDSGEAMLYLPFLNYADGSLEPSLAMMRSPHTVLGLGDGGAHLGTICDASFTTHMLTHWTRDRTRGDTIPVETAVAWHTRDTAAAVGLADRGILAPGYKADLNVIDYDGLAILPPQTARDLPAGGRRLIQRANGYRYTIVSGQVTYRDGVATDALPGRLVRGVQPEPATAGGPT